MLHRESKKNKHTLCDDVLHKHVDEAGDHRKVVDEVTFRAAWINHPETCCETCGAQPFSDKNKQFVLLKGPAGNVFWTLNTWPQSPDVQVLFRSDDKDEMIREWERWHARQKPTVGIEFHVTYDGDTVQLQSPIMDIEFKGKADDEFQQLCSADKNARAMELLKENIREATITVWNDGEEVAKINGI